MIEKPFGHDLESAKALNRDISKVVDEKQVYRIDHYLGKETVQNILAFRFANGIFEPVWNRRYVDHVQVTVAEELGVELRGGYYEHAGALRDMVPNHILQLITLTAMEPPISFDAASVHDEQTKILRAIQTLSPERVLDHAVRGQYDAGMIDGKHVPAYRNEPNVAPDSVTPTFVALALQIDNWRWAGVPFYLRTGKRMSKRVTQIVIRFRRPPFVLFRKTLGGKDHSERTRDQHPAERGNFAEFRGESSGAGGSPGRRGHGFQLFRLFRHRAFHGIRNAALRLHDGRSHAFSARRTWSKRDGPWSSRFSMSGRRCRRAISPIMPRAPADPAQADELLRREGREWRDPNCAPSTRQSGCRRPASGPARNHREIIDALHVARFCYNSAPNPWISTT